MRIKYDKHMCDKDPATTHTLTKTQHIIIWHLDIYGMEISKWGTYPSSYSVIMYRHNLNGGRLVKWETEHTLTVWRLIYTKNITQNEHGAS